MALVLYPSSLPSFYITFFWTYIYHLLVYWIKIVYSNIHSSLTYSSKNFCRLYSYVILTPSRLLHCTLYIALFHYITQVLLVYIQVFNTRLKFSCKNSIYFFIQPHSLTLNVLWINVFINQLTY